MKHILITGGSGFLGINLIRHLLNKGYEITSLDIAAFDYPEAPRINASVGDIRDQKLVNSLTRGKDAVIHAAAALPLYTEEEIYSVDVKGTEALLKAAYKNKIKRFVHISSTAVYGVPDHHPLYENDKLVGVGPYGKAKIAAEELSKIYRNKGMCVSVLRPKSFVGPERLGVFAMLYEWASEGRNFPILGNGNNRYQLLDVVDLCGCIEACLVKPEITVNDVFNVGAAEFGTMKSDFQAVLDRAGFGKKIKSIPAAPAIFLLKILERLKLSPLYAWVYETAVKDSYVSIEKARKQLGFAPRHSNSEALVRNYEWYLDALPRFQKDQTGISHRTPWKQGLLRAAKLFF